MAKAKLCVPCSVINLVWIEARKWEGSMHSSFSLTVAVNQLSLLPFLFGEKKQKGGRRKGKSAKVDLARLRMTKGESAQTSLFYDFLIDTWKSKTKQTAWDGLKHFSWELVKLPNPYSVILSLFCSFVSRIKEAPKNKTESGMSLWWGWHRPICPTSVECKLLWKCNK